MGLSNRPRRIRILATPNFIYSPFPPILIKSKLSTLKLRISTNLQRILTKPLRISSHKTEGCFLDSFVLKVMYGDSTNIIKKVNSHDKIL